MERSGLQAGLQAHRCLHLESQARLQPLTGPPVGSGQEHALPKHVGGAACPFLRGEGGQRVSEESSSSLLPKGLRFTSKESTCSPPFLMVLSTSANTYAPGAQVGLSENSSAVLVGRAWETDMRLGWANEDRRGDSGLPQAVRLDLWTTSAPTRGKAVL